jgi:hypothetical protein
MSTFQEIKSANDAAIRNKVTLGSITPADVADGIEKSLLYADQQDSVSATTLAALLNALAPKPPTAIVVNDSADTLGWTDTGNKTWQDAEYTTNGGTSWQPATANPQPLGNVALAANSTAVRYKSHAPFPPSTALFAGTAFTVYSAPVSQLAYDFTTAGSSADFAWNVYNEAYSGFRLRSAADRSPVILTDAATVNVALTNTAGSYSYLPVYYDGQLLTGLPASGTVTLPGAVAGTLKPLYFLEGLHQRNNDEGDQLTTSLTSLVFPAGSSNTQQAKVVSSKRVLIIGDSNTVGLGLIDELNKVYPSSHCWPNQLRGLKTDYDITLDAWGFRSAGKSLSTDELRQAQRQRAATYFAGATEKILVVAIPTNDRLLGYATASDAAAFIGATIDLIYQDNPTLKVFIQSEVRDTPYTAPLLGLAGSRPYVTPVNGQLLVPEQGPYQGDGVHTTLLATNRIAKKYAQYVSGVDKQPVAAGTILQNDDVRLHLVGTFDIGGNGADIILDNTAAVGSYAEVVSTGAWRGVTARVLRTPTAGSVDVSVDGAAPVSVPIEAGGYAYVDVPIFDGGSTQTHTSLRVTNTGAGGFNLDYLTFF